MTTLIEHARACDPILRPPLDDYTRRVAAITAGIVGLTAEDIFGRSRRQHVIWARQAAVYIVRTTMDRPPSFKAIGAVFGIDHTTAINAVRQVEARRAFDEWTRGWIDRVLIDLAAPALLRAIL